MTGGVVIETESDVLRYGRYEVLGTSGRAEPPEIGERLVLEPCVEQPWPDRRASAERPCPRVVLDPDNAEALVLMRMTVSRFAANLAPSYADAIPPAERARVLLRVYNTVHAETVMEHLLPKGQTSKSRGRGARHEE